MENSVSRPVKTLKHYHFRFKAVIKKAPTCEDEGLAFMSKLVSGIGMEMAVLSNGQSNPIAWYSTPEDNQGMTLAAILTTSNASMHIWDKERILQFDLYSCACYSPEQVTRLVDEYVGIEEIIWCDFTDREAGNREAFPLGKYNDEWKF